MECGTTKGRKQTFTGEIFFLGGERGLRIKGGGRDDPEFSQRGGGVTGHMKRPEINGWPGGGALLKINFKQLLNWEKYFFIFQFF